MRVVLVGAARADLDDISDWIKQDNPRRAISFAAELRRSCAGLSKTPRRFQLIERYESRGIRRRVHGHYLIFYRIDPDAVRVLRILHGARDYEAVLFGDDGAD